MPKWIVEELKDVISQWCMDKMGVELSKNSHNRHMRWLGCNVRKYRINETKSKTLIKPSKDSIKAIKLKIKDIIKSHSGASQEVLIGKLNPVIRGWANYHNGNVAKEVFSAIDKYTFERLWKWACKRHGTKGKVWIESKYWHKVGNRNWVFKTDDYELYAMSSTKIKRHIKGSHYVFDGQVEYWNKVTEWSQN